MEKLELLDRSVRLRLTEDFRRGAATATSVDEYRVPLDIGRDVDLSALRQVVLACLGGFEGGPPKRSDSWLAPRLHASLRLTRREASDRRIWSYLAVAFMPRYVQWRFGGAGVAIPLDRFLGHDSTNAFARLWWAAELTRNGADYSEGSRVFVDSDFLRRWQRYDALHHRPAAIAVVRFLEREERFKRRTALSDQLAKAFNLRLASLSLDTLCAPREDDSYLVEQWCRGTVAVSELLNEHLPTGPPDGAVEAAEVERLIEILNRLAEPIRARLEEGLLQQELFLEDLPSENGEGRS